MLRSVDCADNESNEARIILANKKKKVMYLLHFIRSLYNTKNTFGVCIQIIELYTWNLQSNYWTRLPNSVLTIGLDVAL